MLDGLLDDPVSAGASDDAKSVPELILELVSDCELDESVRQEILSHVIVGGGLGSVEGFGEILQMQLEGRGLVSKVTVVRCLFETLILTT